MRRRLADSQSSLTAQGRGFFFSSLSWGILSLRPGKRMLNCRGWPTSLVLLLRVEVAQLSLPLGCHPSLRLHNLLRLVAAARGLVALGRVEVVEVLARGSTGIVKRIHVVRARTATVGDTRIYSHSRRGRLVSRCPDNVRETTTPVGLGACSSKLVGCLRELTTSAHAIALAGL